MKISKDGFEYIKKMISEGDNLNNIKSFCKGYGLDIESYSSPVNISGDKITIRYRTKNYYVSFYHSDVFGTKYSNKF